MADWSTPSLTTGYAAYLAALKDRDVDIATLFNNGTPTNTPTGAIKLDGANVVSTLQKWSGSAWGNAVTTFWAPNIATAGNLTAGQYIVTGQGISTADCVVEIGGNRSGAGASYVDFHAVASTDYDARIVRNSGANGAMDIRNTGTGPLNIVQEGNAPTIFYINGGEAGRVTAGGFGFGTSSPSYIVHAKSSTGYIAIETSSTTNRRTAIAFRQNGTQTWDVGTDIGASNAQTFYIYDNVAAATRFTIDGNGEASFTSATDRSMSSNRAAGSQYCYHDFYTGGVRRGFVGAEPGNNFNIYGDAYLVAEGASGIALRALGSEKMRITTGGVSIGTTATAAYPLDVNGAIRTQSGGIIFPDATTQTTAAVSGVGSGQTFQSPSRTYNTSYQNTTGKPIHVSGRFDNGGGGASFQVSNDNSTWFTTTDGSNYGRFSEVIPNGAYYRISGSCTIYSWVELR